MKLGQKLLGKRLFATVMKATFYGQFVAGEDVDGIRPLIARNLAFGVKSILDYSVEKDFSREGSKEKDAQDGDVEQGIVSGHGKSNELISYCGKSASFIMMN